MNKLVIRQRHLQTRRTDYIVQKMFQTHRRLPCEMKSSVDRDKFLRQEPKAKWITVILKVKKNLYSKGNEAPFRIFRLRIAACHLLGMDFV